MYDDEEADDATNPSSYSSMPWLSSFVLLSFDSDSLGPEEFEEPSDGGEPAVVSWWERSSRKGGDGSGDVGVDEASS